MEEGGEGRDIVGAGSLHVIDDGGLVAMGDEAMTDARNSVEKKKMETGTAGLYVAGHGSQAVWDGKGDEKRAEGRGEGRVLDL